MLMTTMINITELYLIVHRYCVQNNSNRKMYESSHTLTLPLVPFEQPPFLCNKSVQWKFPLNYNICVQQTTEGVAQYRKSSFTTKVIFFLFARKKQLETKKIIRICCYLFFCWSNYYFFLGFRNYFSHWIVGNIILFLCLLLFSMKHGYSSTRLIHVKK